MRRASRERAVTAEDLLELGDDGQRHELVAGLLLTEPPASYRHGRISARIFGLLRDFVEARGLGDVVSVDTGFLLTRSPDTVRAPDVAFVSRERAGQAGDQGFFPGPPDLAVEVLSPTDRPGEVHAKVADYLAAGTRIVWTVDPVAVRVAVHRSLLNPRVLERTHRLEGEDVLPGFDVAVADLFEI